MKFLIIMGLFVLSYFSIFANGVSEKNKERVSLFGVDALEIYTSSGDIEIVTENRDDIYLELQSYRNGPELFIDKGRTLKVEVKKPKYRLFNFSSGKVKLTVVIPRDFNKYLKTVSSSGDVDISKLDMDELEIRLSSGDLTANNITSKSAKLNASSGDMDLENIDVDDLEVSLSSGSLEIDKFSGKLNGRLSSGSVSMNIDRLENDIELRLSSGSVKINFDENDLNAELELRTSSGDIEVDFPVLVTGKQKDNRLTGTSGDGKYKINITCSSGDISLF
jgi:lia operon protein LiaG